MANMFGNSGKIKTYKPFGCTLTSTGGGGKEILCRMITEDYKRDILRVVEEKNEGISIDGLRGDVMSKKSKIHAETSGGMEVSFIIFDSHKNDIQHIEKVPEPLLDVLVENKSIIALPNSYHGCGGDPNYGIELLENNDSIKPIISKHLRRNCILCMSADGGTSLATCIFLSKYKDELHGYSEPYMVIMSYPQKQIMNTRLDNIEYNKEQIGDYLKRNKLAVILYLVDYAKYVADMNDNGKIIDNDVLDIVYSRSIPHSAHDEEQADLEFIKSTIPFRDIFMGSDKYHKMHMGSRVDVKDLLNIISGKSVIPCYLRAKSVGELSERISKIDDPMCYREDGSGNRHYISEIGIASAIFNSLAPFPKGNRVDKIVYVIKKVPGLTFDYGYLLDCIGKFTNSVVGVAKKDIVIWIYDDENYSNNDVEVWSYLILDDYKTYIEESIKPYALE